MLNSVNLQILLDYDKETNSYIDANVKSEMNRFKRFVPSSNYYVEVVVVVDRTMVDHHKEGLNFYVHMLMHQVSYISVTKLLEENIEVIIS